jgi:ATP-dependent RNA circularization protein (DNA/RNA ligase family)
MTDFFRFPHTPHLAWLGEGSPRDDKVLSQAEVDALLAKPLVVEEKVDGANLGVSLDLSGDLRFQNRGQYLIPPFRGQFARLEPWLEAHRDALFDALTPDLILFGEWCAARHTLAYDRLPDWWLLFDVYDRCAARFWNVTRRNQLAIAHGFATVSTVARGQFTVQELVSMVRERPSAFRDGPLEGLVVRTEDGDWTAARAKLVHPAFVQSMDVHWRARILEWNRLGERRARHTV